MEMLGRRLKSATLIFRGRVLCARARVGQRRGRVPQGGHPGEVEAHRQVCLRLRHQERPEKGLANPF